MPVRDFTDPDEVPYFFWDRVLTVGQLRAILGNQRHPERITLLAHLLREARPDEVWAFASPMTIKADWTSLAPRLGRRRAFWDWLLAAWGKLGLLG